MAAVRRAHDGHPPSEHVDHPGQPAIRDMPNTSHQEPRGTLDVPSAIAAESG